MKAVPMRFCGYTFHHNPATVKIESLSDLHEISSPCCEPRAEHLGNRLRRIAGEGELYGTDCIAQYRELQKLCDSCRQGWLSLPGLASIRAYLKELYMIAEPIEDVLTYRFVFLEARPAARDVSRVRVYETMVGGESLWDISYLCNVGIDTLVALNPHIRYIDNLAEGERVRLC